MPGEVGDAISIRERASMTNPSSNVPPFPREYRASGLLLHITSLPSPYGIGDFGPSAISFVDRLERAGQSWWQVLPLNPTGEGNSPYSSFSSFAANGLLISPDWLAEDGLIKRRDCVPLNSAPDTVDYGAVIPSKGRLLEKAWTNFQAGARANLRSAFEDFCKRESHWLEDYALFVALKEKFNGLPCMQWPAEFAGCDPVALGLARKELADRIGALRFTQFLTYRQAERLKKYALSKGIGLIGDLPFYVSPDSSDVWTHPELFLLDEQRRPRAVGGVPPDYFSADGQLWGDPVYDWDALARSEYRWWISRLRALLAHMDVIRLDHFRAFAAAWHIPAGAPNAKIGQWVPGPGADFFRAVEQKLGRLPFIAEDLGEITPDVNTLREEVHLPGMRVLQFAFDGHADNPHLPENYVHDSVAYTGTHDNPTTRGWYEELTEAEQQNVMKCLQEGGAGSSQVAHAMMELVWSSAAALAVAPFQDLLNLGQEARMNVPGVAEGNWRWRCTKEMLNDPAFEWLEALTRETKRTRVATNSNGKNLEAASELRG
jgi:4-alpha-glucanotransferase